jgi:hypothetical protein
MPKIIREYSILKFSPFFLSLNQYCCIISVKNLHFDEKNFNYVSIVLKSLITGQKFKKPTGLQFDFHEFHYGIKYRHDCIFRRLGHPLLPILTFRSRFCSR